MYIKGSSFCVGLVWIGLFYLKLHQHWKVVITSCWARFWSTQLLIVLSYPALDDVIVLKHRELCEDLTMMTEKLEKLAFFLQKKLRPSSTDWLLEVIQAVLCDFCDHAMTRTVPTGPCCLGLIINMNLCYSRRSSSLEKKFDVTLSKLQRLLTMDSSLFPLHNSVSSFFFCGSQNVPSCLKPCVMLLQISHCQSLGGLSDSLSPDFLNHGSLCSWKDEETR